MNKWLKTPVGSSVIEAETAACCELIPSGYYARSLQIGVAGKSYIEDVETQERYIVIVRDSDHDPDWTMCSANGENCHYAVASSFALPFPERSQSLVVLAHTLDYCSNPHDVLREVDQILEPEGCLVVIGFNLYSLYGGVRMLMKKRGKVPWNGKFYSVGRVQDWLLLLGYDLVGARMIAYRPPINSEKHQARLEFLEKAGTRWWPGFGGVYIIVGKKREIMLTQQRRLSSAWQGFFSPVARPAPQRVARLRRTGDLAG